MSTYAVVAPFPFNMLLMAGLFGSLGILSSATWLGFGTALQRLLTNPSAVRAVNIAMALLLVTSLWPILADAWRREDSPEFLRLLANPHAPKTAP